MRWHLVWRHIKGCLGDKRGSYGVMTAMTLVSTLSLAAFSVNIGYIVLTVGQLQNGADAGALAAITANLGDNPTQAQIDQAREIGLRVAREHQAGGKPVDLPPASLELGHYDFIAQQFTVDARPMNGARVVAARVPGVPGGRLSLFLASLLNQEGGINVLRDATAALDDHVIGIPAGAGLIPYALNRRVVYENEGAGPLKIGVPMDIYFQHLAPGNFAWLDLNNLEDSSCGTTELRDFIEHGFNQDYVIDPETGFKLDWGCTGIHGESVHDALESLVGKKVFLPIFTEVVEEGSNAEYKIVTIVAVEILDMRLTGSAHNRYINVKIVEVISSGLIVGDPAITPRHETLKKLRLVE